MELPPYTLLKISRVSSAPPGPIPDKMHLQREADSQSVMETTSLPQPLDLTSSMYEEEVEKISHIIKRFPGNHLLVRAYRSLAQSAISTTKLPLYLSPWGDNNPVVLPNIRKRDIAMAVVTKFYIRPLLGPDLIKVWIYGKYTFTWLRNERKLDRGENLKKDDHLPRVMHQAGITSVQFKLKHRLMGEKAEVKFFESRDAADTINCAKGWFCPYLYSTSRMVRLSRMKDFTVAEVMGPFLKADAILARILLSCFPSGGAPICRFDADEGTRPAGHHYKRMGIFFIGMSPWRTKTLWSQAKVPRGAMIRFHLLTHIPVVVVPIKSSAPVCAWSPFTMQQMLEDDGYDAQSHREGILRYLDTIIDTPHIRQSSEKSWRHELTVALDRILTGVRCMGSSFGYVHITIPQFSTRYGGVVMLKF